jgi:thiol-disulfide isomerase/thioredoxin
MNVSERASIGLVLVLIVGVAAGLSYMRAGHPLSGQAAPAFTLPIVAGAATGDSFSLADHRGEVVVLDFWASWCPPCRRSIPILNSVQTRYQGSPVTFLGVNTEHQIGARRVIAGHRSFGAAFPTVHDTNGAMGLDFRVDSLPTLFVLSPEGEVAHVHVGVPDESALVAVIDELLPD